MLYRTNITYHRNPPSGLVGGIREVLGSDLGPRIDYLGGDFRRVRKQATVSLVMPGRLSAWNNSAPT